MKAERDKAPATPAPSKVELTKRGLEKKVEGITWVTASSSWVKKFAFGKGQVTIYQQNDSKGRTVSIHAEDGATMVFPWDGGAHGTITFPLDFSECGFEGQKYLKQ